MQHRRVEDFQSRHRAVQESGAVCGQLGQQLAIAAPSFDGWGGIKRGLGQAPDHRVSELGLHLARGRLGRLTSWPSVANTATRRAHPSSRRHVIAHRDSGRYADHPLSPNASRHLLPTPSRLPGCGPLRYAERRRSLSPPARGRSRALRVADGLPGVRRKRPYERSSTPSNSEQVRAHAE